MQIIDLKCRFCGQVGGKIEFPDHRVIDEKEVLKTYVDLRCVTCMALYGRYSHMEQEYRRKIHREGDGFNELMEACEFKKPIFDVKMVVLKAKKDLGTLNILKDIKDK